MSVRYRDAGVRLDVAEEISIRMKALVGTGLFGGFVSVSHLKAYDDPVLVSSIDGVGTKCRLASRLGAIEGLGRDIVHHCVNDIAVHGAEPLFFLDYLGFHKLEPQVVEQLVGSMSSACNALGIPLAGGETAEMPLIYPPGHFDLAGTIVGAVEREEIVDGSAIRPGDVLLGLPSSGLHTNGYSLVQTVFGDDEYFRYEPSLGGTLGETLLEPHRCYLSEVRDLMKGGDVHGLAHITGGGVTGNLARIIPSGLQVEVVQPEPPPIFELLHARGISWEEMRRVFNMGIGMIAVCDPAIMSRPGIQYQVIGTVHHTDQIERSVSFSDRV